MPLPRIATILLLASAASAQVALNPGRERIPGAESFIGTVTRPGTFPLKLYVTRPVAERGKPPVMFQVNWLSCDTLEIPSAGPDDGFKQLLFDLAGKSGYATVRVEKPGVAGAAGPQCSELDFDTELAAYRDALAAIAEIPSLDSSRVVVVGFSNGGGIAPLAVSPANTRVKVIGFMVFSGWYKTWLEHMMELERRRMKLSRVSEPEINTRMKRYASFYDQYLNQKKTPGEIIAASPALKEIWYDKPAHQYGRPARFYHQLQALNLADAWAKVNVPVLAVHPQFDWIMSTDDYRLLVDSLNARTPGSAEFIDWPRLDHGLLAHEKPELAFGDDPNAKYDPALSGHVLAWLTRHSK